MKIEKLITEHQEMYKAFLKQNEKLSSGKEQNLLDADGKFFTAEIKDIKCKGRVRVEGGELYLCQDEVNGLECKEKYGYKYSWFIKKGTEADFKLQDVTNFKLWDYLPKDGEYIYLKTKMGYQCIAIAKEGEYITTYYVSYSLNAHHLYSNENICCSNENIAEIRPATPEEREILDSKLAKKGKFFDAESKTIKDIEKPKHIFKEGDWFVPHKPKDVTQHPTWPVCMDNYNNKPLQVESILFISQAESTVLQGMLRSNGWAFHPDWCEKVEAPVKPNEPKVGDLCIFWNNDKSEAIIGIMTDTRPFNMNPYLAANSLLFYNCIPFVSGEQFLEFIKADTMDQATN